MSLWGALAELRKNRRPFVIAGPCAVESEEQLLQTAEAVRNAGAHALRGGAFKPRTHPNSFQGLGEAGLKLLAKAREKTGLPVVTELLDTRDTPLVAEYADILQIGSRSSQNFPLLREAAKTGKPILLKRGLAMTLEEWLAASQYILESGNNQVILCERGIRTFETATRHTLDLNVVPLIKERSPLPVIVDPSHGTGKASLVGPMSMAALACGADGLLIEVHPDPKAALSDGQQSLDIPAFQKLMKELVLADHDGLSLLQASKAVTQTSQGRTKASFETEKGVSTGATTSPLAIFKRG